MQSLREFYCLPLVLPSGYRRSLVSSLKKLLKDPSPIAESDPCELALELTGLSNIIRSLLKFLPGPINGRDDTRIGDLSLCAYGKILLNEIYRTRIWLFWRMLRNNGNIMSAA